MEAPGFITVLYIMYTLPGLIGIGQLPWENWAMAGLFVRRLFIPVTLYILTQCSKSIHYIYRAIISPLIAPSMSPMSPLVWLFALLFQIFNGISIGGWLAGYGGKITRAGWADHGDSFIAATRMELGLVIFALGLVVNMFHDDELREIRRSAARQQREQALEAEKSTGKGKGAHKTNVEKIYMIPKNGFFWWIFYPHYVAEWFEWTGFWLMGGATFTPGRTFLVNEIFTMLPRAIEGKQWYIDRFGEEEVAGRMAIIPYLL